MLCHGQSNLSPTRKFFVDHYQVAETVLTARNPPRGFFSISTPLNSNEVELVVAYRVYPRVSHTPPPIHPADKLALASVCLRSFKAALGGLAFHVHAILDACPDGYEALFRSVFNGSDITFHRFTPKLGNEGTFNLQIDLLLNQTQSDLVYFAEDDYVYLPNSLEAAVEFIRSQPPEVTFVTPHGIGHPENVRACDRLQQGGRTWTVQYSTMLTFLTHQVALSRYHRVIRTYCDGNTDFGMWMALTKKCALDLGLAWRWWRERGFAHWSQKSAWQFCANHILFGRRAKLWGSVPPLGTHMVANGLATGVEWPAEFRRWEN